MKLLKTSVFILMIALTSCETEVLNINNDLTTNLIKQNIQSQTRADFTGRIKRIRIKKRGNSSNDPWKMIASGADGSNGIHHYAVSIEEREGVTPSPSSFDLNLRGELDEEGLGTFIFKDLNFEGENPEGKPFLLKLTPMDIDNNQVALQEEVWATVQDNDGVDINNVLIKETNIYGIYKYKVNLRGPNASEIAVVNLSVAGMDNDLIFPVDGSTIALEEGIESTSIWASIAVTYESASDQTSLLVTPGNTVAVTVSTINALGEIIDSEVHNIIVAEKPQEEGIISQPVTIKLNNNGNGFKIRTKVKGTDKDQVRSVNFIFEEPFEGPAPLETEIQGEYIGGNITTNSYRSQTMNFDNPEEVIGLEYLVLLDYIDENGNPVGQQTEQVVIVEGNEN
ncbi:MAG: hypothetical protein ACI849_001444 [Patiriisocius sp.]|jgi:hypothetical protein